jgi:tRNA pseudouridine55 synthase
MTVFGLLNVDKPVGPTSHDVVARVRSGTGERRVGHAGTLDPIAGGVLVLALGRATRLLEYLTGADKVYHARVTLGVETDTYDAQGTVVAERPIPPDLTRERVERVLGGFWGAIRQVPPAYSAVKIGGKAAYKRARDGETVELEPRTVHIHQLELAVFDPPALEFVVACSSGMYVRSLVHDFGQALGCGALMSGLTRIAVDGFDLADAVGWDDLRRAFELGAWRDFLLPADLALGGSARVYLDADGARRVEHGMPIPADGPIEGLGRAYAPDGRFVAVLHADPVAGVWRPKKVFI